MSASTDDARARILARLVECVPVMEPGDGLTAHDIWKIFNSWSLGTVRNWLTELAHARRIVREAGPSGPLYRRSPS